MSSATPSPLAILYEGKQKALLSSAASACGREGAASPSRVAAAGPFSTVVRGRRRNRSHLRHREQRVPPREQAASTFLSDLLGFAGLSSAVAPSTRSLTPPSLLSSSSLSPSSWSSSSSSSFARRSEESPREQSPRWRTASHGATCSFRAGRLRLLLFPAPWSTRRGGSLCPPRLAFVVAFCFFVRGVSPPRRRPLLCFAAAVIFAVPPWSPTVLIRRRASQRGACPSRRADFRPPLCPFAATVIAINISSSHRGLFLSIFSSSSSCWNAPPPRRVSRTTTCHSGGLPTRAWWRRQRRDSPFMGSLLPLSFGLLLGQTTDFPPLPSSRGSGTTKEASRLRRRCPRSRSPNPRTPTRPGGRG